MKNTFVIAAGTIAIVLLISGLWCWFVPVHMTDSTSYGSENPIRAIPNVKIYEDILFPPDSFNQEIFVGFASSTGNFTLIMLTTSNLESYTSNESYSALFAAVNVTSVSQTVNLTEPVTEWSTIVLFSNVDELSVTGEVSTQCDAYYRWLAPAFFVLAVVSFAIIIVLSILKHMRKG